MLIKQINRGQPEQIFGIFKNNNATASAVGDSACHMVGTTPDGVSAEQPADALLTANIEAFIGIWDQAVDNGDYGRILTYGYHSSVALDAANTDIGTGNPLKILSGSTGLGLAVVGTDQVLGVYLGTTTQNADAVTVGCFIKAM